MLIFMHQRKSCSSGKTQSWKTHTGYQRWTSMQCTCWHLYIICTVKAIYWKNTQTYTRCALWSRQRLDNNTIVFLYHQKILQAKTHYYACVCCLKGCTEITEKKKKWPMGLICYFITKTCLNAYWCLSNYQFISLKYQQECIFFILLLLPCMLLKYKFAQIILVIKN